MATVQIYLNEEREKKVGSLAELYGKKMMKDAIYKIIDDTYAREFPASKTALMYNNTGQTINKGDKILADGSIQKTEEKP